MTCAQKVKLKGAEPLTRELSGYLASRENAHSKPRFTSEDTPLTTQTPRKGLVPFRARV